MNAANFIQNVSSRVQLVQLIARTLKYSHREECTLKTFVTARAGFHSTARLYLLLICAFVIWSAVGQAQRTTKPFFAIPIYVFCLKVDIMAISFWWAILVTKTQNTWRLRIPNQTHQLKSSIMRAKYGPE